MNEDESVAMKRLTTDDNDDDELTTVGNNSNDDDKGDESDDNIGTEKNINGDGRKTQAPHHQSAPLAVLHKLYDPADLLFFFQSKLVSSELDLVSC